MHRQQFLRALALLPLGKSMAPSLEIQSIVDQARQAWLQGDAGAFAALFLKDGEFMVPGQVWRGPEAISGAFQAYAANHVVNAIEIRNLVVDCDRPDSSVKRAVVEWYWQDTNTATGETSRADDAIAIDVQGDRIRRWREYIDSASGAE